MRQVLFFCIRENKTLSGLGGGIFPMTRSDVLLFLI